MWVNFWNFIHYKRILDSLQLSRELIALQITVTSKTLQPALSLNEVCLLTAGSRQGANKNVKYKTFPTLTALWLYIPVFLRGKSSSNLGIRDCIRYEWATPVAGLMLVTEELASLPCGACSTLLFNRKKKSQLKLWFYMSYAHTTMKICQVSLFPPHIWLRGRFSVIQLLHLSLYCQNDIINLVKTSSSCSASFTWPHTMAFPWCGTLSAS
jgi:hypothetical protein